MRGIPEIRAKELELFFFVLQGEATNFIELARLWGSFVCAVWTLFWAEIRLDRLTKVI